MPLKLSLDIASLQPLSTSFRTESCPVAFVSPTSQKALNIVADILDTDDFISFKGLFGQKIDEKGLHELLKTLNYSLKLVKSPKVTRKHLETLVKILHQKFQDHTIFNIPLIHRLYFHIYDIEKSRDPSIGGENWGELHAFEDKDRLTLAFERLILEFGNRLIQKEASLAFDALKDTENTYQSKLSLAKFRHIFEKSCENVEKALGKLNGLSPKRQDETKKELLIHAIDAASYIAKHRPITWLSGTSSYTLIGMQAAKVKGLSRNFALIPSGILLRSNIAPLAGELGGGIEKGGINLTKLSGCMAEEYKNAFGYSRNKSYFFDQETLKRDILEKCRSFTINFELLENPDTFNRLKIDLLRALHFLNLSSSDIEELKQTLMLKLQAFDAKQSFKERLQNEITRLFEEKATPLTQELKNLLKKPAYPIVFATNIPEYHFHAAHSSSIRGETTYAGSLELGRDIQFAITDDENLEEVTHILKDQNVSVISFKIAEIFLKYHFHEAALRRLENF